MDKRTLPDTNAHSGVARGAISRERESTRGGRVRQRIEGVVSRVRTRLLAETGDVPGWVLITLMTAAIVVILAAVAGPALSGLFQQAIDRVSGL